MKEFKINEFLILKLEGNTTKIYLNGILFRQCKFLMLNIAVEDTQSDEIESIDEAADILGWGVDGQEGVEYEIDPETEFWGHCSNLQAWYENDYDTRLLHSNLSFPLLKKLAEAGDHLAKKVIKEEIAKRFESGYPSVVAYIIKTHLLDLMNREEREQIIIQNFLVLLTVMEKLPYDEKRDVFNILIDTIRDTEVLNEYFPALLESVNNLLLVDKYDVFSDLIDTSKGTGLLNKYHSQVKTLFFVLLESIDKLPDVDKYDIFSHLIESLKGNKVLNEYFPALLESINKFLDDDKHYIVFDLISLSKGTEILNEHLPALLENIDKLLCDEKNDVFFHLLDSIKGTEILNEYLPVFLESIDNLPDKDKWMVYSDLINSIKGTEILNKHSYRIKTQFLALVDDSDKLPYNNRSKYYAFYDLFDSIKGTELIGEHFSLIETQFLALLNHINELPDSTQYDVFTLLIKVAKETELMEKHYSVLLGIFPNLPDINKLFSHNRKHVYSEVTEVIKDTKLEDESIIKRWRKKNQGDWINEIP